MRFRQILFIVLSLANLLVSAGTYEIKTVVIDAGHGGKDPGAIGPGKHFEKDVALAVALKLGSYIEKNFPDVNVVYTRKTDVFIELHERAAIANKAKADLFIAIHCNSSTNDEVYGTSTYVLGLHKTEANLEVAKRENSVIMLEDDRDKNYEFNPNSPEGHIIMSMKQNAFLDQSIQFASSIETSMENSASRKSLGVKQAGFYVLYKTTMPSLLAEIGFISNPDEERFLTSTKGQDQIAISLLQAFKNYKNEIEGSSNQIETNTKSEPASGKQPEKKPEPVKPEPVKFDPVKEEPKKEVVEEKPAKAAPEKTAPVTLGSVRTPVETSSGGGYSSTTETIPAPKVEPLKKTETVKATTTPPAPKPETTSSTTPAKTSSSNIQYKVQLFCLREGLKDRDKLITIFGDVSEEPISNGLTRYYGGNVSSMKDAQTLLQKATSNGYKDAYIVGFKDGKRLSYEQLKALEN